MTEFFIEVEGIDYKPFPKPLQIGAVGMVYGKITNGLTANFFSELIYPFNLDTDRFPSIEVSFALRAIRYSATSEVLVALQFLQGHGWFEDKVQFLIHGVDPWDEIRADGWADEWGLPAQVDMGFYLEDVVGELEASGKEFSKEWYYAKASHLYFSDVNVPEVAMTIGILLSQLWWKVDLADVTERGQANTASLNKANKVRKVSSIRQSVVKNEVTVEYWFEALAEFGRETMRRDSNASQAIYAIALRKRPKELLIKSTGKIIGAEAIRKRVSALRKLEKIG